MNTIHWFEYAAPKVSSGERNDAHYLGCSRGAPLLLSNLTMFTPGSDELGLGFKEPHWDDWPSEFRGGVFFRAIKEPEGSWQFILGYIAAATTNDGRGSSRGLWYVVPCEWFIGQNKLSAGVLLAAIYHLLARMTLSTPGAHARLPGATNEPYVLNTRSLPRIQMDAAPWQEDLESRAHRGLRFHGSLGLTLVEPAYLLAAMIVAARRGIDDDEKFQEFSAARIAVLAESIEGTEFGWLVPYNVGVRVAPIVLPREDVPPPPSPPRTNLSAERPRKTADASTRRLRMAVVWAVIATILAAVLAFKLWGRGNMGMERIGSDIGVVRDPDAHELREPLPPEPSTALPKSVPLSPSGPLRRESVPTAKPRRKKTDGGHAPTSAGGVPEVLPAASSAVSSSSEPGVSTPALMPSTTAASSPAPGASSVSSPVSPPAPTSTAAPTSSAARDDRSSPPGPTSRE